MKGVLTTDPAKYILKGSLGEGLNSCVYRAIRKIDGKQMDQVVALKILKSRICVQRWRQEVENLIRVNSPFCASILGWESFGDQSAIVLEYIEGVTLKQLLMEEQLSDDDWSYILHQALLGLEDLKEAGIFHGDIHAGNIMIDRNGRFRWIDFGYAGIDGMLEFTPDFAAPEIFNGQTPNLQTDLYSLGSMVQQLSQSDIFNFNLTLCHSDPAQRTSVDISFDSLAQTRFRERVRRALTVKFLKTTTHIAREKRSNFVGIKKRFTKFKIQMSKQMIVVKNIFCERRWLSPLCLSMALLTPLSVPQASLVDDKGFLVISTQQWMKVWVDELLIGYTPIRAKKIKKGRHLIRWSTKKNSGIMEIEIEKNRVLLLTEKQLMTQNLN